MTATEPTALICPTCRSVNTMIGVSGVGRCFDCAHEWDPTAEVATVAIEIEPFAMAPVEDVYGPDIDDDVWAEPASQEATIGGTARLEGGQLATVLSWPSVDSVELLLNDGRVEVVNVSDVERITERAPDPETAPVVESVDDLAAEVQMAVTLAQLIIMAGVTSVEGEGADVHPVAPPVGFLPDDPALMPTIEKAAAIAVGMIIVNMGLNVDELVATLAGPQVEEVGDQTTEETA